MRRSVRYNHEQFMSLQTILQFAVPMTTFFLMIIVGMDVTSDDFRKVLKSPKTFLVGTLGQCSLPLCAWLVLIVFNPIPAVTEGMVLVASAPAGGISTYYSYLAGVNVALSIVLTSVSCILAAVTMPLLLRLFHFLSPESGTFLVPIPTLFGQLIRLLVIPVLIGFIVRAYKPDFVVRFGKILRRIGFVALGFLIVLIFNQTWDLFLSSWLEIVRAAALFIFISMLVGYAFGMLFRFERRDSFTLLIEYGTRNTAICTTTAVIILHRTEFATFAAIYFLVEAILIVPLILLFKHFRIFFMTWRSSRPGDSGLTN